MAKRRPKRPTKYIRVPVFSGLIVALFFILPAVLGIALFGMLFSAAGIEHAYEYVFIGFSIPCALILFYRWRTGKWFDPNDPPED